MSQTWLRLGVCRNFLEEYRQTCQASPLCDGVGLLGFPAACGHPPLTPSLVRDLSGEQEPPVLWVGGACLSGLVREGQACPGCRWHNLANCFQAIAGPALVEHLLQERLYLVSSGWLASWPAQVAQWGFAGPDLQDFFRESVRGIHLLDTGVDPAARKNLQDFADRVGLPASWSAVGLETVTRFVEYLVLREHRERQDQAGLPVPGKLPGEQVQSGGSPDDPARVVADYMMAMDLMGQLNRLDHPQEALGRLLEIFEALFAPRRLLFVEDVPDRGLVVHQAHGPDTQVDAGLAALVDQSRKQSETLALDQGFLLPLHFGQTYLGCMVVTGLAFPEYLNHYRNLAAAIMPVCALALVNLRNYDRLCQRETELKDLNQDLQGLNATKDRIFAIIGHDFKGPLGALRGLLELMLEDDPRENPAEFHAMLEVMARNARDLYGLLENLLDWARSQRGEIRINPVVLDLGAECDLVVRILEAQAKAKGVLVDQQVPRDLLVELDRPSMQTVLRNLVANAIKYTPAGGRVVLSAEAGPGQVRIAISDTGVGMSPDRLATLSASGSISSTMGTNGETGTGLGLILCREFVGRNGGILRMESAPGQGTRMELSFPPAGFKAG